MKRAAAVLIIASLFPTFALAQKKTPAPQVPPPPVYRGLENPNAPPDPQTPGRHQVV
jgi:hypothetical protein